MSETKKYLYMPAIPMRSMVVFPKSIMAIDVARSSSVLAFQEALKLDQKVFLIAQRDPKVNDPVQGNLYSLGTVAKIKQCVKRSEGEYRLFVEGAFRAELISWNLTSNGCVAELKRRPEKRECLCDPIELEAAVRNVRVAFHKYASVMPNLSNDIIDEVDTQTVPLKLFYFIGSRIPMKVDYLQRMLEENDLLTRLHMLIEALLEEAGIVSIQREFIHRVEGKMDQNQREYFLKEQMRMIQDELDLMGDDPYTEPDRKYLEAIEKIKNIGEDSRKKLIKEAKRLQNMPENAHEAYVIENYLDTVLELPWDNLTEDQQNLKKAKQILDKDHYGLKDVKNRILDQLAVRFLSPNSKGQILCLAGPPGVGKTSVGRSIAKALGRKFVRISLGGVSDEAEVRGHRKTYIGAMPGRIISWILQAKTRNPVLLLDEIDKLGSSFKGDPSSAMLEVLDSEQNCTFTDHYIDIPFDLSECFFITTANNVADIPAPLLDRMELIELSSYTLEEKYHICKEYLIPKQLEKNGLSGKQMRITKEGIYALIDGFTREAGVRSLERLVSSLCRKTARQILENKKKTVVFTPQNLEEFLGPKKYINEPVSQSEDIVGVVNGLAYTSAGGELLQVEASVMDGKGQVQLTGSLGDVLKESAQAAISYVRTVAESYKIPKDFYKTKDIHIHLPEGATPKDGPSAGVALTVAVVSALANLPVHQNLAMTGEITLRGRVLPIGGLKEKAIAAYKSGIQTVLIPKENMRDLAIIDDAVKEKLTFIPCGNVDEALKICLAFPKSKGSKTRSKDKGKAGRLTMEMDLS